MKYPLYLKNTVCPLKTITTLIDRLPDNRYIVYENVQKTHSNTTMCYESH